MSCEGINDLAANHIVLSARIRLADEHLSSDMPYRVAYFKVGILCLP